MNIRPCFKYQMTEHIKVVSIYWLVILICTVAILLSLTLFVPGGIAGVSDMNVSGFDFSMCIVLIVTGLVTFYTNFGMMLQFGATRRSLFISRVLVTLLLCAVIVILNRLFQALLNLLVIKALNIPSNITLGNMMDSWFSELYYPNQPHTASVFAQSMLWEYGIYIIVMSISNFFSVLYYRLNLAGRIGLSAGAPVLFTIIIPTIDIKFFGGRLTNAFVGLFLRAFGFSPMNPAVTITAFFVTFAVFSVGAWLLMRRASLKKR